MKQLLDFTGRRFGRLVVTGFHESRPIGSQVKRFWKCVCDCGSLPSVSHGALQSGRTKSCGCLQLDHVYKHGMHDTKEHQAWRDMKIRCLNPKNKAYQNYGGRGITIHESWVNSFERFYQDVGPAEPGQWLERDDNNGNYEPGNVRWATRDEQQNNRRQTIKVEFAGKTLSLAQWAKEIGVSKQVLYDRRRAGWPIELMLSSQHRKGVKGIGVAS